MKKLLDRAARPGIEERGEPCQPVPPVEPANPACPAKLVNSAPQAIPILPDQSGTSILVLSGRSIDQLAQPKGDSDEENSNEQFRSEHGSETSSKPTSDRENGGADDENGPRQHQKDQLSKRAPAYIFRPITN